MNIDRRFIVYNLYDFKKRNLYTGNYNDDIDGGLIYFSRESLNVIFKKFLVVGYCVVDKCTGIHYPIDFVDDKISLFEGPFNCMGDIFKNDMQKYNIENNKYYYSEFMKRWQFLCDSNCFKINNYYSLSSFIIGDNKLLKKCIEKNLNIFYPNCYLELCHIIKNVLVLFEIDYMNMDFLPEYKQLLYSFENNILINFDESDIYIYLENFCKIVLHYYGGVSKND